MSNNEGMSNGVSMVSNLYNNLQENNLIYIGLFVVIILCVLTIYFLYTMIGQYLFLKVQTTVSETEVPIVCNKSSTFKASFSETGNGRRRSYAFWIYIYDISKNYNQYKTVVAVSDDNEYSAADSTTYRNASPHIFLDRINNSLYCHFYDKDNSPNIKNFQDVNKDSIDEYMRTGIKIDYVPIQRWVHVAIVINSDSFSTNVYAYVDADLVNTGRDKGTNKEKKTYDYNNINLNRTKYLLVGGDNTNVKNGPGFSGLISKFSCYNYELNQQDIINIYKQGPVSGFLAYLGLGLYGVRNPIYKL